ncbi:MAG: carboxypeptidase-like regulatory domain-containing protein [Gemmatimonadales bacterium]|nr:carboxypeptidase-like regulatory domain-containing protein [Gemmatimonadales bacterium]MYC87219.1 carboxypeptidase-like regulatory domain-containing protein [Candidatus Palauibacter denitrificans]
MFSLLLAMSTATLAGQDDPCGDRASLEVTVLDESGTTPIPGAMLVLHWSDLEAPDLRRASGADGRQVVCVPPGAREAVLWAEVGDQSSEQATLLFEPGEAREIELRIVFDRGNPGRLIGSVYDVQSDDAVAAAAISVMVYGRERSVESNRRGRFILSDVRPGVHELRIRRLGYATLRQPVTVNQGLTTEVNIGLAPTPVEMEPIVATVTRIRRLEIKGFYERKYWGELTGNGYFFDADYIERWRPSSIESLIVSAVPGIGSGLTNRRMSEGFSGRPCGMKMFLNGMDVRRNLPRLHMVEIAGVEVYKGPASLPAEFTGSDSRCGAVVVWTK